MQIGRDWEDKLFFANLGPFITSTTSEAGIGIAIYVTVKENIIKSILNIPERKVDPQWISLWAFLKARRDIWRDI